MSLELNCTFEKIHPRRRISQLNDTSGGSAHSLLAVVLSTLATLGFGITFLSLFRYQTLTPTLKLGQH